MQVSVVQSSASTSPASVSPPPPPHTHTHTHTHFMLAGKRAGGERKIIMYVFQCVDLVIFQFSKHVHHVQGNTLVYKFVQVFGKELFKHLIGGAPSRSAQSYQPL